MLEAPAGDPGIMYLVKSQSVATTLYDLTRNPNIYVK